MTDPQHGLSRRERQIMDILYRRGRATAGDVMEELQGNPSYSTVRTQLRVLEEKGHVRHEEDGLRYVYAPATPRRAARKSALRHLVDTFFDGSAEQTVAALLGGEGARLSEEELDRIAKLVTKARKMLDSALKASAIVALALAANGCLRARSAALRHCVLAAALGCALAVPVIEWLVPAWDLPFERADRGQPEAPLVISSVGTGARPNLPAGAARRSVAPPPHAVSPARLTGAAVTSLFCLWVAGAAVSVVVLMVGLWRLGRLTWRAEPLNNARWRAMVETVAREFGVHRSIRLRVSDHPTLLVTWGHFRPMVLVPRSATTWTDDRMRVVLSHEIAHVQRRDWLALMIGEALRAVYWFNPLVWIACQRMRQESEQACDDMVLGCGVESSVYAGHLIDIARTFGRRLRGWLPAPAMVRVSSLERRIDAMLNPQLSHGPLPRAARVATICVALTLTAGVAAFEAQTFGSVSGSVVDATNRTVAGATLRLTSVPDQAKHELRSDAGGRFEFVGLPPGAYRLEASAPGFTVSRADIVVAARPLQQIVMLQVGSLMETVTVSSVSAGARRELAEPALPDSSGCVAGAAGGKIQPPRRITDARPAYPAHLHQANVEGHVILEGRIGTDGAFRELQVVTSAHPDFDSAALEAVGQWRFTQTLLNCVPVEVSMTVHLNFVRQP